MNETVLFWHSAIHNFTSSFSFIQNKSEYEVNWEK